MDVDSPSKALLAELGLQADTVNRSFHARLDHDDSKLEKEHKVLLAAAALQHEQVRETAEIIAQQWQLQLELQRQREAHVEWRNLEEQREEIKRLERLRVEAEERAARELAAAAARPISVRQDNAAANTSIERGSASPSMDSRGTQTIDDSVHAALAQPLVVPKPPIVAAKPVTAKQPSSAVQSAATSSRPLQSSPPGSARSQHQRYLVVHARLKELRQSVNSLSDTALKKRAGEFRREIKKSVGQLTVNMAANTAPYNKIRSSLNEAAALQQPQVNIMQYIVADLPQNIASATASMGLIQIYLLNIFSKAVVSQLVNEAGVAPKSAEPIGTVAIRIFAANEFRWQSISLIDILIAKFHAVCPVLFGMYPRGPSARKQKQGEALTGLGSGFAALSLRDFGKSAIVNPFPPSNFWQSVACVVNAPPNEVTQEHSIVLKALIENHAAKFIKSFGQPAVLALRKAVVEFPRQVPKTSASSALATLQVTLRRDIHLTL